MVINDEKWYIDPGLFGQIDHRLRDIMEEAELPFGGIPLFVVGDFFQLAPVAAADLVQRCSEAYHL